MSIEIADEAGSGLSLDAVRAVTEHVYAQMRIHPEAEVFIRFATAEDMADLHVEWMDLPGPTDVMSFPMDELRPGDGEPEDAARGVLGDIVVCPEVAASQAAAAGHSTLDEVLLLTVHGLLHLMGYDHAEEQEKAEMFGLQRRLLLTYFAEHEPGRTSVPDPTEG
ncbi:MULTISPECIES: rRNA maturation RNase YbeY [Brevibacterium]|jgi:probable rRNA maturation factor|uniref:Endoribonuclease YbeY n=1 Tax=Brevibacterium salitolerans TaxID=1403566 RepID=A0ABN2WEK0_9MICO|nr:rRNA maturation RNase YbeY [Brevibacterium sp.]